MREIPCNNNSVHKTTIQYNLISNYFGFWELHGITDGSNILKILNAVKLLVEIQVLSERHFIKHDTTIVTSSDTSSHVIGGPCHYRMACPQVVNGGMDSKMEVVANVLNNQSRRAEKGWSSILVVG
jgi:hypothetical protein